MLKLDTPQARIFPPARSCSNAATTLENWVRGTGPVQQIQIEIVSAETSEARLASTRHRVLRHNPDADLPGCNADDEGENDRGLTAADTKTRLA
jgi:hypothetical protein